MSSIWSARDMSSSESLRGIGASVKAGGGENGATHWFPKTMVQGILASHRAGAHLRMVDDADQDESCPLSLREGLSIDFGREGRGVGLTDRRRGRQGRVWSRRRPT